MRFLLWPMTKTFQTAWYKKKKKYCLASQIKDHGNETIGSVPRGWVGFTVFWSGRLLSNSKQLFCKSELLSESTSVSLAVSRQIHPWNENYFDSLSLWKCVIVSDTHCCLSRSSQLWGSSQIWTAISGWAALRSCGRVFSWVSDVAPLVPCGKQASHDSSWVWAPLWAHCLCLKIVCHLLHPFRGAVDKN